MTVTLMALAAVEIIVSPGSTQTVLRCGLVLGGFVAMAVWVRLDRVALDQQDWCECAGEKIIVRVISSRWPEPERVEDKEREETRELVLAG